MERMHFRTDLALEAKESFEGDGGEIAGVSLKEIDIEEVGGRVSVVDIFNDRGEEAMNKPKGKYITIESESIESGDEWAEEIIAKRLAEHIEELLCDCGVPEDAPVLIAGIGNRDVTSDALGPRTADMIEITRHLQKSKRAVSGIVPGVMADTGIESAQIIKGVIDEINPKALIAIDALAARSVTRLGNTIQLTNTGIQPGSGVGNHRCSLTKDSLGIPVIAIGVPTVVTAAALVYDTAEAFAEAVKASALTRPLGEMVEALSDRERYSLIRELIEPKLGPMFVTPKDIDERVQVLGRIVSMGINMAMHNN